MAVLLWQGVALNPAVAQPVSGVWHGRVDARQGIVKTSYRVELKLARQGDSLYGTSYYHTGRREYTRFPVKGYFNPYDGTVTWWHAEGTGIDEKGRVVSSPLGRDASFIADFNCPGGEEMSLDGELLPKGETAGGRNQPVHFEKVSEPVFRDEWDEALRDPTADLANLTDRPRRESPKSLPQEEPPVAINPPPVKPEGGSATVRKPVERPAEALKEKAPEPPVAIIDRKPSPESLFESRERRVVAEIPLKGDTLELNFYDHAEIDGDTVSIFHNGTLIKKHLLLRADPFTLRFHVGSLPDRNDFTMVAENLGRIPPNTSLLVAYVDGVRHEARLESTENESAAIRFDKPVKSR